MSKRIAVITDATSSGFWFPKWYDYYLGEFGAGALHVITYGGARAQFAGFDLAGLWDVPQNYDDALRARLISSFVRSLLMTHDVVVRCDVDEFLIPDLRSYSGLKDFITRCTVPYVTAYGIDVFEREGDLPIDMSQPMLVSQRRHGVINTPLHKTAITTVPLEWSPGFHAATAPPAFDALYMFHMKFADVQRREEWFRFMKSSVKEGGSEYTYFSFTEQQMNIHKAMLSNKAVVPDGWSYLLDVDEKNRFLATVTQWPSGGYQGAFTLADSTFLIPDEFNARL